VKPSLIITIALLSLWSAVARAQTPDSAAVAESTRPERPFRGLFGEANRSSEPRDLFDLQFSAVESYDDNVLGDQGVRRPDPRVNTSGSYSLASADARYQHTGRGMNLGATGGSTARYYTQLKNLIAVESHADVHLDATLGKTRVMLGQAVQDTPFYSFRFFPAVGSEADAVPGADQPITSNHAYMFNTSAGVTHNLSTRSELSGSYALRYTDFTRGGSTDFTAHSARAGYRYQMTRYAALRAGYGIEQGTYASASTGRARLETIDLGVDYRRPLSFSRRTLLDFGLGSTAASTPAGARVYRLAGDAGLTHEIGRTWNLRAAFHRGTALIEGLASPVFSDAATISLGGYVNRRIDLHTEGAYASGEVGVTGGPSPFDSLNARGQLRVALGRQTAVFGEYFYYRYHFRTATVLSEGLPPNLQRQGIRLGLTVFVPVLD
jgi:hypothetical protein